MKNQIKILQIFLFTLIFSNVFAQQNNDPVLLNVAGENITKSEFLRVYQKNNAKDQAIDKKALDEYLELYINFKLKVKEAEELGLDTNSIFKSELNGYRATLAQPYLVDKDVTEDLIKEAYSRMLFDVRASHILIRLDKNAIPSDTLATFNKIMALRKRILSGEAFEKIAAEASEDPSAKDVAATSERPAYKGNGGDLGYFTSFDMIYPFENAAFNTKVGEVSMPIRSEYGYHLIKVTDKKKAMGRVQIAHLLISVPQNASEIDIKEAKIKAYDIMAKLKNGEKFDTLVKQHSDDKGSANKGGVLPEFGVNRMIPEFIVAISKLNNPGDYSEPILSRYGWHIIKLVDRKEIKSLDELKNEIKQKVAKDERANKSKESFLAKVKVEYNFTENLQTVKDFYKVVTDSVFTNSWKASEAKMLTAKMFSIGTKNFTQTDFAAFLAAIRNENPAKENLEMYVNRNYKDYVERCIMQYADNKLEEKYPDFKSLMKEYHDGILLFDLTDKNVWTKAIKDTVGLKDFYQKNTINYMWGERLDATMFTFKESKIKEADARKFVEKILNKQWGNNADKINEQIKKLSKDSAAVTYIHDKYSKGDNKMIDQIKWQEGIAETIKDVNNFVIVLVNKKLIPEQKTLTEAKGIVTADYQNYLEKEWLLMLRKKYSFSVNKEVYNSIK
ncbi:MAG: peptidylprolyl isomerase [Bacteroidetes bacterium]|nr:peptidylprolyl isomerase [Bacteroidota bacterium]